MGLFFGSLGARTAIVLPMGPAFGEFDQHPPGTLGNPDSDRKTYRRIGR